MTGSAFLGEALRLVAQEAHDELFKFDQGVEEGVLAKRSAIAFAWLAQTAEGVACAKVLEDIPVMWFQISLFIYTLENSSTTDLAVNLLSIGISFIGIFEVMCGLFHLMPK